MSRRQDIQALVTFVIVSLVVESVYKSLLLSNIGVSINITSTQLTDNPSVISEHHHVVQPQDSSNCYLVYLFGQL